MSLELSNQPYNKKGNWSSTKSSEVTPPPPNFPSTHQRRGQILYQQLVDFRHWMALLVEVSNGCSIFRIWNLNSGNDGGVRVYPSADI